MRTFLEYLKAMDVVNEAMTPEQKLVKKQVLEKFGHMTEEQMLPLPYNHSIYFKLDNPNTRYIPIKDLSNIRAREEGIKNALIMMYAASIGENMGLGKRVPVSVKDIGGGKYEIFDGNSTFNIAKRSGWKDIPVLMVDDQGNYV